VGLAALREFDHQNHLFGTCLKFSTGGSMTIAHVPRVLVKYIVRCKQTVIFGAGKPS